jgi:peptide deformylase
MLKTASAKLSDQIRKEDPIIKYGDPVLRQVSKPVIKVGEDMPDFVDRMKAIMTEANGVGLAAPQLGILQRVIVYDTGDGFQAMVNPKILRASGEQLEPAEGCLSIPGLRGTVKRAEEIVVKALDENGQPIRVRAEGYSARVIQHEVDHLDGILFIDKADPETLHWMTAEEKEEEDREGEPVEE